LIKAVVYRYLTTNQDKDGGIGGPAEAVMTTPLIQVGISAAAIVVTRVLTIGALMVEVSQCLLLLKAMPNSMGDLVRGEIPSISAIQL
jgi:hypothetical protein